MAYKALSRTVVLENLSEGRQINIDEYIEKLRFFGKYGCCQGIYITDSRYIEYQEIGLHYFKYDTLIKFFEDFKQTHHVKYALITFGSNHRLQCEPVQNKEV